MNYAGKFEAFFSQGQGAAAPAHVVHGDSLHAHAPADAVLIPDAQLLFNADFHRSGVDLILSEGEREFVVHDYFKGEKRAPLASPDGAHLTGDLVNALAGSVQVGQAGVNAGAGQVIGHVTKLQGNATVTRNGVSITLHQGDNVEKGDVVQSGSDSTLGITFIDGTVFGLSSNARMVLNEMVYDAGGSSNSTLFSLVAGTISFVAGETAKHGDMKIDTPVATMGIRGTAVLVEIDFTVPGQNATPNAKFQVLVEPDGTTGSYILFDKTTLQPIAVVNQAGQQVNITNGVVSQTQNPLSPELQKLINDVFTLKFTDNTNPNPKTTVTQNDSITPTFGPTIKLADGTTATPLLLNVNATNNSQQNSGPTGPDLTILHIPGTLKASVSGVSAVELAGLTSSPDVRSISTTVAFVDANPGDDPSVSVSFVGASYQGHSTQPLNALQLADIKAAEVQIAVVPGPGNNNNGSATLTYSIPDKAFDFLAQGETLTLTYSVRVDSNFAPANETALQQFTITITGTNDKPVITTAAQTVAFSGGTKTSGGPLTTDSPTTGTLAFTDVDLTDTHKVSAALNTTTVTLDGKPFDLQDLEPTPFKILNTALSAQLATDSTGTGTGSVTWTLADLPAYVADFIPKGETLTLTYQVTVTDSQGATSTQDVTVTITGTEPAAEVWISSGGEGQDGNWTNGTNWETGNAPTATDDVIIITDQLHGLTPSFPVTIDGETQAQAKSVSMNDFGTSPPKLVNDGTLTVGGTLKLEADSIVQNFGTMTLGGLAEILNKSTLTNSGTLVLGAGGDFQDQSSVTNTGTIELKGGTLNVSVDIANSDGEDGSGQITVDTGATLALGAATIYGGTITVNGLLVIAPFGQSESTDTFNDNPGQVVHIVSDGIFDLQGFSVLKGGTLNNTGQINVSGAGNLLDGETVDNSVLIDITGSLTLDHGTTVTNLVSLAAVTVESGGLLTLNGASITGGLLTNKGGGTVDLAGSALIENATLDNHGLVNVSGSGNALDGGELSNSDVGAISIAAAGTLILDDGADISGGKLTNSGVLDIESASGAVLDGVSVDNSTGSIEVDGSIQQPASTLTLMGTTAITGGKLTVGAESSKSLLDVATGADAKLSSVCVGNFATVQVEDDSMLELIGAEIVGGALIILGTLESSGASEIDKANIVTKGTVEVLDGKLAIDYGSLLSSGTLKTSGELDFSNLSITNGGTLDALGGGILKLTSLTVTNSGAGNVTVETGAELDLASVAICYGSLTNSGTVDNQSGASTIHDAVIVNQGTIESTNGVLTIDPDAPVTLTNEKGGIIDAHGGEIDISSEGVTNAGTLEATNGGTLRLESLTVVNDGGTLSAAAKSTLDLMDADIKNGDVTIDGTLDSSGKNTVTGAIVNDGVIEVKSGTLDLTGPISGHGTFVIDKGATLEVNSTDTPTYSFMGTDGELVIDKAGSAGTINGLAPTDKLDLRAIKYDAATTATYDADSHVLTVKDGTGDTVSLTLSGADYGSAHFAGSSDGLGGTLITLNQNDDAPVIAPTDKSQSVSFSEASSVTGSPASDPQPPAGGSIAFTDVDLTDRPTATISAQSVAWTAADHKALQLDPDQIATLEHALSLAQNGNTNNGTIDWSYAIADSALDFLGAGQTATITSTVTLDDHRGGTDTTQITVTIAGANDVPQITSGAQAGSITEMPGKTGSTAQDSASGTITFKDADQTDTHEVTVTSVAASGDVSGLPSNDALMKWLSLGPLSDSTYGKTGSETWTFSAQDKNFDYLAAGHTLALTYTVQVDDHHGGVVTTPVTITVTGTDDAPVIVGETDPSVQTVILAKLPIVLADGANNSALDLPTETFDGKDVHVGSVSDNGEGHGNFHSSTLNADFTASGDAGVVHGSSSVSAAPFEGPGQADSTNYLSIGAHGQETISFNGLQNTFGLYWGSVDSYNSIDFYNGTKLVASYTGSDVSPLLANGGQGSFASNGYVEFNDLAPFNKVVLGSSQNAFELDNVSAGYIDDSHVGLANPITGTISVTDKDIGDTLTASMVGDAVIKYNGSSSLPANANIAALIDPHALTFDSVTSDGQTDVLHWTYHPTGANLDFLEPGDTLSITFKAQVSDGLAASGVQALTVTIAGNGSSVVNGTAQNDTFVDVGGGVSIFGKGGNDTFVFNSSFGSATINDFDVNHDSIEIDASLFKTVDGLLSGAHPSGQDTIITDAAHDTIILKGVTLAQLNQHQNDLHII